MAGYLKNHFALFMRSAVSGGVQRRWPLLLIGLVLLFGLGYPAVGFANLSWIDQSMGNVEGQTVIGSKTTPVQAEEIAAETEASKRDELIKTRDALMMELEQNKSIDSYVSNRAASRPGMKRRSC